MRTGKNKKEDWELANKIFKSLQNAMKTTQNPPPLVNH